jgi:hypothetical protein
VLVYEINNALPTAEACGSEVLVYKINSALVSPSHLPVMGFAAAIPSVSFAYLLPSCISLYEGVNHG